MVPNNNLHEEINLTSIKDSVEALVEQDTITKGPGLRALTNKFKKELRRSGKSRKYTKVPTIEP